jgi:adenosine deaminase CECR1
MSSVSSTLQWSHLLPEKWPDNMDEFNIARDLLIKKEKSLGWDADAIATATLDEQKACGIVDCVREYDDKNTYSESRNPGGHFLGDLDFINHSELLKVAQAMPKGCHLHCHYNACLPPQFFIEQAKHVKAMYIRSSISLTSEENKAAAEIQFTVFRPPKPATSGANPDEQWTENNDDVFRDGYAYDISPGAPTKHLGWMPYQDFLEKFAGGERAAEDWLGSKLIFTEEEVHGIRQTRDGYVF